MKLTKLQLKQIIKEELALVLEKGLGQGTAPSGEFYKKQEIVLEEEEWQQEASADIEKKGHEGIFKKWCKNQGHGGVNQACINAAYKAGAPWKKRAALAVSFSRGKGGAKSLSYPKSSDAPKN